MSCIDRNSKLALNFVDTAPPFGSAHSALPQALHILAKNVHNSALLTSKLAAAPNISVTRQT
jgi:hypothetical protein